MLDILLRAIVYILLFGVLAILGLLVGGGTRQNTEHKAIVLRYSPKFRGFGVLILLLVIAIIIAIPTGIEVGMNGRERTFGLLGLAGSIAALGLPIALEGFRKLVVLNEQGITTRSWFGAIRQISWTDIERIRNCQLASWFRVSGGGQTIRINHMMADLDLFIRECKQRVNAERYGNAFNTPIFNDYDFLLK